MSDLKNKFWLVYFSILKKTKYKKNHITGSSLPRPGDLTKHAPSGHGQGTSRTEKRRSYLAVVYFSFLSLF
jgi:hypothetical protein